MNSIDSLLEQMPVVSFLPMHQCWAAAIFWPGESRKTIENRNRALNKRGRIGIYATLSDKHCDSAAATMTARGVVLPNGASIVRGALLGTVEIVNCTHNLHSDEWVGKWGMPRSWHWHLENPIAFDRPEPFRAPGQGWFYVDRQALDLARAKGITFGR